MTSVSNPSPAFVFLGPSGSGKDTQAEFLASKMGDLPVLSTGALFRKAVERGTPLGKKAVEYMERGEWVPDDLVRDVLRQEMNTGDFSQGLIFTGFPRTLSQCHLLDEGLKGSSIVLKTVFHLDTSVESSLERMHARREEEVRSDDTDELFMQRIQEYEKTVEPILDFYQEKGLLVRINNEGTIDEVSENILKVVQEL